MTRHLPAALAVVAALVIARVVRQARTHELCPEWGPGSCRRWPRDDDAGDLREHALRTVIVSTQTPEEIAADVERELWRLGGGVA